MTIYKTSEQHFLANIIVRISELHVQRRRNRSWIRLQRTPESREKLEQENALITGRIRFLQDAFNKDSPILSNTRL